MRERGAASKTVVFCLLEKNGDVMMHVVLNVRRAALQPIVEVNVVKGSGMQTDELPTYRTLAEIGYPHTTVNMVLVNTFVVPRTSTGLKVFEARPSVRQKERIFMFPADICLSTLASFRVYIQHAEAALDDVRLPFTGVLAIA